MTDGQEDAEVMEEDGPSAEGRDEAEDVVEELKEHEDEMEEGSEGA